MTKVGKQVFTGKPGRNHTYNLSPEFTDGFVFSEKNKMRKEMKKLFVCIAISLVSYLLIRALTQL